jgi:hypothetical protein
MSNDNPPADHVISGRDDSGVPIEENLRSRSTWLRLLFMLAFYVIGTLTTAILSVVVVLGFVWVLFTGEKNGQLQQAGQVIAGYLYGIVRFLTFNTEEKPFPFGDELPSADAGD